MAKRPLYIQLEPGAYPKDIDWQIMSAQDRGCYHSLIIYLACSNGKLFNKPKLLANLCNIDEKVFEIFWSKFSHKFLQENGEIQHKRINEELKKARKMIRQKSLAGKASGKARRTAVEQPLNGSQTAVPTAVELSKGKNKGTKDKGREEKELNLILQKKALRFAELLEKHLGPFNSTEAVTFKNISIYLLSLNDPESFDKAGNILRGVTEWAANHGKEKSDMKANFNSKIQRELGWNPKK
jgi:uncharacterized protein YdaU (DUF1376 family)